jgi:hypothetical protein
VIERRKGQPEKIVTEGRQKRVAGIAKEWAVVVSMDTMMQMLRVSSVMTFTRKKQPAASFPSIVHQLIVWKAI